MFGLFGNKKTALQKKYDKLLAESHRLSHVNRKQSDLKLAEANEVLAQMDALENKEDS